MRGLSLRAARAERRSGPVPGRPGLRRARSPRGRAARIAACAAVSAALAPPHLLGGARAPTRPVASDVPSGPAARLLPGCVPLAAGPAPCGRAGPPAPAPAPLGRGAAWRPTDLRGPRAGYLRWASYPPGAGRFCSCPPPPPAPPPLILLLAGLGAPESLCKHPSIPPNLWLVSWLSGQLPPTQLVLRPSFSLA